MSRHYTVESNTNLAAAWSPVPRQVDIACVAQTALITLTGSAGNGFYLLKVVLE